ncbi:hypothetical protein P5673_008707 [Acropora cervicornis]|uniref:Integrase catalytic domain-containing protein n=1 Tax=Acropora cervicornis TaxID=6130 RepID=A0AAD9VAM4_ACRCE|nr:hypothetical protein P5673_008707 [Acropora cervicornis]
MAARTNRTSVIRERNERGFRNFLQSLKAVFHLFLTPGNEQLTTDALRDARRYLLDAKGTLSLLLNDLSRGDPNPTGLPANAIQAPLRDLRESVTKLLYILSVEIEKREQESAFYVDAAYSAGVTSTQLGPGRRRYDISKEQLEHLRSLFFSWKKIADMLQVSVSTIQRRRKEFGLDDKFESYSDITDDELDEIYASITGNSSEGPLTPYIGRRRFIGALRSRGLRIQRWRVSDCLRRVDPVGTALRWQMTIHRRKYFVPTPNSLWHIDSGHKLIRYKLITHVCIDGKTRLLIYASCCDNNKADTVLSLFQKGVEQWGLPSRVRCDYGMENFYVGQYMIDHRGEGRGSIITGSSVHNSRVERAHRDIYSGVLAFYARIFEAMEDEGILEILDNVHLYSLHYVFIARINRSLDEFIQQMNNHPVSSENNQSPLQMWEKGMLDNMHSGYTALSPAEIDDFGVDPEGLLPVDEEDYQVNVSPPSIEVSDNHLTQMPCPLQSDENSGVNIFKQCVELLNSFLS